MQSSTGEQPGARSPRAAAAALADTLQASGCCQLRAGASGRLAARAPVTACIESKVMEKSGRLTYALSAGKSNTSFSVAR